MPAGAVWRLKNTVLVTLVLCTISHHSKSSGVRRYFDAPSTGHLVPIVYTGSSTGRLSKHCVTSGLSSYGTQWVKTTARVDGLPKTRKKYEYKLSDSGKFENEGFYHLTDQYRELSHESTARFNEPEAATFEALVSGYFSCKAPLFCIFAHC